MSIVTKLFLLIMIFCLGCANAPQFDKEVERIVIPGFDDKVWKQDSIACNKKRQDLAMLLKENIRSHIVGKSKASLLNFLGPPNIAHFHRGDTIYTYFVGAGRQCYDSLWRINGSESEELLFIINDQSEVLGYTGPIYP